MLTQLAACEEEVGFSDPLFKYDCDDLLHEVLLLDLVRQDRRELTGDCVVLAGVACQLHHPRIHLYHHRVGGVLGLDMDQVLEEGEGGHCCY